MGYAGTRFDFSELNEMSDEQRNAALAEGLSEIDQKIEDLKAQRKEAVTWLSQYVYQQGPGTTVIAAGEFEIKVSENVRWQYDVEEGLVQLTAFGVRPEEYEQAVQPSWSVNKAKLNKLAKRGGRIAEIIDQNCHKTVTSLEFQVRCVQRTNTSGPPPFVAEFVPARRGT